VALLLHVTNFVVFCGTVISCDQFVVFCTLLCVINLWCFVALLLHVINLLVFCGTVIMCDKFVAYVSMCSVQHKGLMGILGENSSIEGSLGLGELADLNVNNEGDSPISDVSKFFILAILFLHPNAIDWYLKYKMSL